ncbi:hypothetical protein [Mucilaginibacter dorajii]|uniref:Uncharacterized protein n=1 Tax=Mucilaginibacter dorajii TaxID=692994 RepID=A0ABP7PW70_9SPHI|nr:hypothetical protein [Mucilaginibacter dorajii]MCS3737939.1 hypothetical protein [Mucilaginibacter dorajii]
MNIASLRIDKKKMGLAGSIQETPYYERLVKLIPGEIISIYVTGQGIIPKGNNTALWVWSAVCLVLLVVLRAFGTRSDTSVSTAQWPAVLISAVSFIIWLYTLGGVFATLSFYQSYIGSLLVITWTFIIPFVYKGD